MESTNNRFKASLLHEEDEHLSSFRKRNNRLIIILFSLIILVGLIMGAIIISFSHEQYIETSTFIHSNPAVNSFCSYTYFPSYCSNSLNFKIKPESKTDPNQLFSLSLDIAIEELTSITPLIDNQTESAFKNCSSLVQDSLSQLTQALGMFRVNPDVRKHTDEQRSDLMRWIRTAEQDLSSCYDDLAKIESTAVTEIRAQVDQAKIYLKMRGKNYGVCHSCRLKGHFFADCPNKRPCPYCKNAFLKCFEVEKNTANKGKLFNTCSEKCGFWEWVKEEEMRPESTSVTGTQELSCSFETRCRISEEQEMKIDMTVTIRNAMEHVTIWDKR